MESKADLFSGVVKNIGLEASMLDHDSSGTFDGSKNVPTMS